MNRYGFARISAVSPLVAVGNPRKNLDHILNAFEDVKYSDVVVFPELCVTGYTCGDLFKQHLLLEQTQETIWGIAGATKASNALIFIGAPLAHENKLYNCAIAIHKGIVIGVVPKQNIPNYNEFYESRWFRAGDPKAAASSIYIYGYRYPFGTKMLFQGNENLIVHAEVCEDLWMPIPPSSYAALAGANVLVNLSASNETVAKNAYRTELVKNQSGRCIAAYVYASAGPSESTTDLVFGGHCLIAENGTILVQSKRVGDKDDPASIEPHAISIDVDCQKLQSERRATTSFGEQSMDEGWRRCMWQCLYDNDPKPMIRKFPAHPFIPSNAATLHERCAEIFGIQMAGLYKRLDGLGWPDVYIGVSGGLDSTLALLVAAKAFRTKGEDLKKIHGITMPGYGTTAKTKLNAADLMEALGISTQTIDIREVCLQIFKDMRHDPFGLGIPDALSRGKYDLACFEDTLKGMYKDPDHPSLKKGDLVFENVQARARTLFLMSKGFVLGTGDLSEAALGWCTYNGDHMSMYNVNTSIPKTLVKFLVQYVEENQCASLVKGGGPILNLKATLKSILNTTISPELLPVGKDGEIVQSTEDILGPYMLHDFFLFHFVRNGYSPEKILWLALNGEPYELLAKQFDERFGPGMAGLTAKELIEKTLKTFIKRFFTQQFKRSCVPDGPKVGSVSLSPRGDWRMPSDSDFGLWMKNVE